MGAKPSRPKVDVPARSGPAASQVPKLLQPERTVTVEHTQPAGESLGEWLTVARLDTPGTFFRGLLSRDSSGRLPVPEQGHNAFEHVMTLWMHHAVRC